MKTVLAAIQRTFDVKPVGVTRTWLDNWAGLTNTSPGEFPEQLGLSMIAYLNGKLGVGHSLMLSLPFDDLDWMSDVRERILALSSTQRFVAAEYLKLVCDLGDSVAKTAWTVLWSDIFDSWGDLKLAWGDDFVAYPHIESIRYRALEKRVKDRIRNTLLNNPKQRIKKLPKKWSGLGSVSLGEYPNELGSVMLGSSFHYAPLPRMMLVPGFGDATQDRVRECILSLSPQQRMAVAEYIKTLRDRGVYGYVWGLLWRDIFEARGEMTLVWDEPFAASPYPSKRIQSRAKGLEKAIQSTFQIESTVPREQVPEHWEGLASVPLERYANELGAAMIDRMHDRVSYIEEMMLIPYEYGLDWQSKPYLASQVVHPTEVQERIMSMTPHQRVVVAAFLKFRADIGDSIAQQALTCLWNEIYEAGGEMSLVW